MKQLLNDIQRCLNHVFLLEQLKNSRGGKSLAQKPVAWSYAMEGHAQKMRRAILRTGKQESGAALQKVSSPCLDDHQFKLEELESVGELSEVCSQNCLKKACTWHELEDLTCCGRFTSLQGQSPKWTQACDRRLARLISFIHHTKECQQCCHVGNTAQHCRLGLFQDSDFAGDLEDSKSTSG